MKGAETSKHFAGANENAKLVKAMVNLVRRARLDYEAFRRVCARVRKAVALQRPPRSRRLPRILCRLGTSGESRVQVLTLGLIGAGPRFLISVSICWMAHCAC